LPRQEQRNILAIAVGLRGIAAIRAVSACAGAHRQSFELLFSQLLWLTLMLCYVT
jgi:hypothetical protein